MEGFKRIDPMEVYSSWFVFFMTMITIPLDLMRLDNPEIFSSNFLIALTYGEIIVFFAMVQCIFHFTTNFRLGKHELTWSYAVWWWGFTYVMLVSAAQHPDNWAVWGFVMIDATLASYLTSLKIKEKKVERQ